LQQSNGLNKAMIFLLERTINYLQSKHIEPDKETLAILEDLKR